MSHLDAEVQVLGSNHVAIEAENIALKQRVSELEKRLSEVEAELVQHRAPSLTQVDIRTRLRYLLFLLTTLLLAAFPPFLVVQDRWFGNQRAADYFREPWEQIGLLSTLAFPPYFIVIFICCIAVFALFFLQKNKLQIDLVASPWNFTEVKAQPVGQIANLSYDWLPSRISYALLLLSGVGFIGIVLAGILQFRRPGWDLVLVSLAYVLGWLLREIRIDEMAQLWRRYQNELVAALVFHVALVAFLADYYSPRAFPWVYALLLALAAINLLRFARSLKPVFWIVTLALLLFTLNIDGWWFSVVGDEYSFYRYARNIAENQSIWQIGSSLFNGQAVYNTHPYFSSLLQAISMKLFGSENFGWRFSNVYFSAMAIGLFFGFFQAFVRYWVALVATLLLAASHYLMTFGKIGYNNLQAFLALGLTLGAASWAVRTKRPVAFVTLGFSLTFCFYVYPAALYALPLPALLLLFYFPPTTRSAAGRWALTILSMLIPLFPLFLQPDYWKAKVAGTIFYNPQIVQTAENTVYHFVTNFSYTLFSYIYVPEESHFVAVSYVDPLTAVFVLIGAAYLLTRVRRERFATFFIAGYVVLFFLVGASHDRRFPTPTRMFMLLPWFALFAAVGLAWLAEHIKQLGLSQLAPAIVTLIVMAIVGLNLYQAYPLSQQRMANRYQTIEVLFLRLAERVLTDQEQPPKKFVFINDPGTFHIEALRELLRIYTVPFTPDQIVEVVPVDQNIPAPARSLVADRNSLVIVSPRIREVWRTSQERAVEEMGKVACNINTMNGVWRFTVWHAPDLTRLCESAAR